MTDKPGDELDALTYSGVELRDDRLMAKFLVSYPGYNSTTEMYLPLEKCKRLVWMGKQAQKDIKEVTE